MSAAPSNPRPERLRSPESVMIERRSFVRLSSRLKTSYKVIGVGESLDSLTRNTGGGGVCFFTDSLLAPGTILRIVVTFPAVQHPITFTAEVIWSGRLLLEKTDKAAHRYQTGVRFLEIASKDRLLVIQYCTAGSAASSA